MASNFTNLQWLKERVSALCLQSGGDLEVILRSKLVVDAIEQTQMPVLCLVCHISKVRLVASILEQGADVNASGKDGMSPLHIVCCSEKSRHAHLKIAQMLVKHGANLNTQDSSGSTPLLLACHSNQTEMVEFLLASGCNNNIPDLEGQTPFSVACQMATDQWYFWNNEYLNSMEDEDKGGIVYGHAGSDEPLDSNAPDENFPPVVICKLLLQAGVTPTQATLLPSAVLYGTVDTVREFLQLGMSVNMMDKNGRTPLGSACKASHISSNVAQLLLEHGADVNEDGSGRTGNPIILASVYNSIGKMRILLSYGATVSSEPMSELVSVCISKWFLENPEVILEDSRELLPLKLLLKAGFRPNYSSVAGKLNRLALCSSYTRIRPWVYNLMSPLLTLTELCRINIRTQLQTSIDDNVSHLPLPNALKDFLKFEDFSTKGWKSS